MKDTPCTVMKRILPLMVFLGFIVPILLADKGEKEISLKKAPKKVQLAVKEFIKEKAKGGEVEEVTVEKEDGKKIYEVEIEAPGGWEYELEISADGKILEVEKEKDDDDTEDGDDDDDDDDDDDEEDDDDEDDDDE